MTTLREVVRCHHCRLNQFAQVNRLCRRCKNQLKAAPPEPQVVPTKDNSLTVAQRIFVNRLYLGISQTQLAKRMGVPRTFISKLETGGTRPTVATVKRLALGLGCPITELLPAPPRASWSELEDPELVAFMQQMADHVTRLNREQLSAVLHEAKRIVHERIRLIAGGDMLAKCSSAE